MIINRYFLLLAFITIFLPVIAEGQKKGKEKQQKEIPDEIEARLEDMTAKNEDEITEDESYLQDLDYFTRHPLNLNTADRASLERLNLLRPSQIDHFLTYRNLFGRFLSIYEIQAIPDWDVGTIRKLLPYITVNTPETIPSFLKRFNGGEHLLLTRYTRVLEKSEGHLRDGADGRTFYPGSADKYLLRYNYRFKNQLRFGITAEKDAGEQFFSGNQQKGFDFYSVHLYARDIGIIKTLAIGDFSVNLGQGLIQWQSLSFAGPGEAMFIKKQGAELRPYVSAGEAAFNRGAGITLGKKQWRGTAFVSFRNLDASMDRDTIDFATSIRLSGFHRTESEIKGAGMLRQSSFGGNIQYDYQNFHAGLNTVQYHFGQPLYRGSELYKKFLSPGDYAANYSIDYSYTYRNIHFFGEIASDRETDFASINGLSVSADKHLDISLLHRSLSKSYFALYGDAFTQSTTPANEKGLYMGINIRPNNVLQIDGYADVFHSPWLKYRVDAPSNGADYMMQLSYRPGKQSDFYIRFRSTNKPLNTTTENSPMAIVENKVRKSLRIGMRVKISDPVTFRSRVEAVRYDGKRGFLMYTDVLFKPMMRRWSGNMRLQYFETEDYDSRIYAFENDVLYSYSIPVFYGKGYRYYLNARYNLSRGLSIWTRIAQTKYSDREEIGSGLDKLYGNKKTEVKIELVWRI